MSQSDPTDHVLAAIASILDQPEVHREPPKPAPEERPIFAPEEQLLFASEERPLFTPEEPPIVAESRVAEALPVRVHPIEAHGYCRVGPGPIASIRFKWTVREDRGDYYVDETIGENSAPMVTGPLTREAALQSVDDREADARRRFEALKSEMSGRGAPASWVSKKSGEA